MSLQHDLPVGETPARHRRTLLTALVAVLCAVLGFALVAQVRQAGSNESLAAARPDDLVQILDGLQRREDVLDAEITQLAGTLARLRSAHESSAEALAEADRQADALGILAGTVPARGPGVRLIISDPDGTVPPEVLLAAIQELRNAGGEAFQVDDIRIGVNSAFTGSAGHIDLDGTAVHAPFTILAIGDPPTLAAAMAIPGGVLDTVRRAGGALTTTQERETLITAVRAPLDPQPAPPTR